MEHIFSKYFSTRAIALYCLTLFMVSAFFKEYAIAFHYMCFGIVEVILFFYYGSSLSVAWQRYKPERFQRSLFLTSLIIRLLYVLFSYFFYLHMTGQPFEFEGADALFYQQSAMDISYHMRQGNFWIFSYYWNELGASDSGYLSYLGIVYYFTQDSILFARCLKAVYSAFCVVLIYKLAKRNFGEDTGRLAGLFSMLMPNLIYYCGLHLKEIEMLFIVILFLEKADFLIRTSRIKISTILLPCMLAILLFSFRTVLGAVALFSLGAALLLTSSRFLPWKKRIVILLLGGMGILFFIGGPMLQEVQETWEERFDNQSLKREQQVQRGMSYAKYATSTVMMPLMFVVPFSTMVTVEGQDNQLVIHGGNYVKNIMGFFVIAALVSLILVQKDWCDHSLLLCFIIAYLGIVANSGFANAERFQLPALPGLIILWAYGVTHLRRQYFSLYNIYVAGMVMAIIIWNWFKLSGRGLV